MVLDDPALSRLCMHAPMWKYVTVHFIIIFDYMEINDIEYQMSINYKITLFFV